MKKSLRFITLILAAIFLIVGTALIANADAGAGASPGAGSGSNGNSVDDGGEAVDSDGGDIVDPGVDPGVDAGNGGDSGNGGNSGNSGNDGGNGGNSGNSGNAGNDGGNGGNGGIITDGDGGDNGGAANDDGNNSSYDGGNDSGYDNNQSDDNSDDSGSSSYQLYVDDSPLYYGDAQNYDYNSSSDNDRNAGKIEAKQYDAQVDPSIKAQKWENLDVPGSDKDIKLNSGSADGDVSFKEMKANNSKGDDMGYIPYIGAALVALAVLGILYFIIATVTQRKKKEQYAQASGAYASNPNSDKPAKKSRAIRYADDYDDGYSSTRKGSKADTGEIHLPRRFK